MEEAAASDIERVKEVLSSYLDSDADGGRDMLREDVSQSPPPRYVESFRRGLAFVVERRQFSAVDLERLTNYAFDSDEDAQSWLAELQEELFGPSPA